ncbi:MAG: His-Xaa-Ser system protein HxsD [Flavobacteriales bacterium]|nr:His-Xaa-Ser system protein HxsD [Flavobacteriales bacterium]
MPSSKVVFDGSVYSLDSIKRALYKFADKGLFELKKSDSEVVVEVVSLSDGQCAESLLGQLRNEVIDQDLREMVKNETQSIRELILANAFSKTKMVSSE